MKFLAGIEGAFTMATIAFVLACGADDETGDERIGEREHDKIMNDILNENKKCDPNLFT